MSDLINRSKLLRKFSVNSNGDKIPEYDIDNFPVTLSVKDIKEIIRNEPTISDKEIRNKVIDEFAEALADKIEAKYCRANLTSQYVGMQTCDWIKEIAEQMKEVGE